jgi:hypothetical protein
MTVDELPFVTELGSVFERFCTRDDEFALHAMFGEMSKAERMRHAYLHFDHHLQQFGV